METKVLQYISNNKLIPGNKVTIAVSGGIDSMALLYLMKSLGYDVTVAHINHNVRAESYKEYDFVCKYAKSLGCKFVGTILPKITKGNFHDEARRLRYRFLLDASLDNGVLLTAHHLDDQVETILMKMMRGSNLYGYSGIKNKTIKDGIIIARPFLCLTRKEISDYVKRNSIPYVEDSSNLSDKYLRNQIRHHVIPFLKEENPNLYKGFDDYSRQIFLAFNYIRSITLDILKRNNGIIKKDEFITLDEALQNDLLDLLFSNEKIESSKNKIDEARKMILNDRPNSKISLKDECYLVKSYNEIKIEKGKNSYSFNVSLTNFGQYPLDNDKIIVFSEKKPNNGEKYLKLCYNKLCLPLTIRNRIKGDIISYSYGRKKLKDLFIDKKIPLSKRDQIPVVVDANNDILGLIGIGPSSIYRGEKECYLYLKETIYDK